MKKSPVTPTKGSLGRGGSIVQEEFLKFYKDSGLEPLAREVLKKALINRSFANSLSSMYLNLSAIAFLFAFHNS